MNGTDSLTRWGLILVGAAVATGVAWGLVTMQGNMVYEALGGTAPDEQTPLEVLLMAAVPLLGVAGVALLLVGRARRARVVR